MLPRLDLLDPQSRFLQRLLRFLALWLELVPPGQLDDVLHLRMETSIFHAQRSVIFVLPQAEVPSITYAVDQCRYQSISEIMRAA